MRKLVGPAALAATWLPSLPGVWLAEVVVRRAGADDISATFEIQVGP